jgi:hypothetical protein
MAKDGPNWDGLLKWSLSHADGTRPTRQLRYGHSSCSWFFRFCLLICLKLMGCLVGSLGICVAMIELSLEEMNLMSEFESGFV